MADRSESSCKTSPTEKVKVPPKHGGLARPVFLFCAVLTLTISVLGLVVFLGPAGATKVPRTVHPRAEVIDGVPLVPITNSQRAACVKWADHLKRRVPCPGLLPVPIPVSPTSAEASCLGTLGETACGPAATQVTGDVFLLSQSNFEVPPGYVGVTFAQYGGSVVPEPSVTGGALGHFVFMAGRYLQVYLRDASGKHVPPVPRYCTLVKVSAPISVHGSAAKLYQCADASRGPNQVRLLMGHDLLEWNDAGITCEVSFHGHSQVNQDLDVAEADATVLVSPTRR